MYWTELIIETEAIHTEPLSNALIELGALSVDIHDAKAGTKHEQPLFEQFNDTPKTIWPKVEITSLFEETKEITVIMRMAINIAKMSFIPVYRTRKIKDQNWVRLTQSQFEPIQISSKLWITPSWHQAPDDPSAINLTLDPGMAFGTGSHPTTQLCLTWLEENIKGDEQILDYGCGSGILAIAALKLGADHVIGVDIDPQAVKSSIENAANNKCDKKKIKFILTDNYFKADQGTDGWADVVIANILANPLIILAPILMRSSKTNGHIVLSGILMEQVKEVEQTYQQWFKMHATKEKRGWALLTGTRK